MEENQLSEYIPSGDFESTTFAENSVSLDIDRENLDIGYELLERLEIEELNELRKYFFEKIVDPTIKEAKGSVHPQFCGFKLDKEEFVCAVENVLGETYNYAASKLFEYMVQHNVEVHKGFVWWGQFLNTVISWTNSHTQERPWNIVKESFCRLTTLTYCKRETIVRIVPIETNTSFCYVMVSRFGHIGLFDWDLQLLENYEVKLGAQEVLNQKSHTTWVTDAVYLPDAYMLVIAASDRSFHVYSATGLVHVPTFHISGLPNIPTSLHYTIGATTEDPSLLLWGDEHGSISTMRFHQPQYSLFKRTSSDRMETYFWKELDAQKDWVTVSSDPAVHKDEVLKVEYISDNNTVISCSSDPNASVSIRYLSGRREPYIFQISRGVRCFHLDRSLKLLVTGSKDSVIRMWNPVITKKPLASLFGHKSCVIDVRILKHLRVILSMSKDVALKVWDIDSENCLQSLPTLFPAVIALARTPEFGAHTFYPGPVCCNPPSSSLQGKRQSHNSPLPHHPASHLTSSSSVKQDRASAYKIEGEWSRMEVLVVCCNYVVTLQLSERELAEDDTLRVGNGLPPPLREHDPAVPSPWLTADSAQASLLNVDHSAELSSGSEPALPIPSMVLDTIQKSLGEEMMYQFKGLTSACHNLNAAKAKQYINQKHVWSMVEQCAPHLALNIYPLEEIKLSPALPTTAKLVNVDLTNTDKLLKAKLKHDSMSTLASKASHTTTSTHSTRNTSHLS